MEIKVMMEKQKNSFISLFIDDLNFIVYRMTFISRKNEDKSFLLEVEDINEIPNIANKLYVINYCFNFKLYLNSPIISKEENKVLIQFDNWVEEYM